MPNNHIIDRITEILVNLEDQGEIVITSAIPSRVAEKLCQFVLDEWIINEDNEPIECTIPYLLEQITSELCNKFSVGAVRAKAITNAYYNKLIQERTLAQVAEYCWHHTPAEIARRAYYHLELGKADSCDIEYLDWRKAYF